MPRPSRRRKGQPIPPDVNGSISRSQINLYWGWLKGGCPSPRRRGRSVDSGLFTAFLEACVSTDQVRLGALAGHESDWVRLGVAGNRHTPVWAKWGDGLRTFGLAEDPSPWVSATVLLSWPRPPVEVVEALRSPLTHLGEQIA